MTRAAAQLSYLDPDFRPAVAEVVLDLPEPPSVNKLFANVSVARRATARAHGRKLPGRVKSHAYLTWINAAGWELKAQRPGRVAGLYQITIASRPDRKDIGNLEKATSDFLQEHRIVANDSRARRIVIEWNDELPPKRIRVTVRPWSAE